MSKKIYMPRFERRWVHFVPFMNCKEDDDYPDGIAINKMLFEYYKKYIPEDKVDDFVINFKRKIDKLNNGEYGHVDHTYTLRVSHVDDYFLMSLINEDDRVLVSIDSDYYTAVTKED